MTLQNTSFAVMQQRAEPFSSLDDFPSPPWATRALMEHVIFKLGGLTARLAIAGSSCLEPACGRGHMKRTLDEYFGDVEGSDIFDYGHGAADRIVNFLDPTFQPEVDWVVMNPPFKSARAFCQKALRVARVGVAVLERTSFTEGNKRYKELYLPAPPTAVAQFVERVPMHRGKLRRKGKTATSYCWIVWVKDAAPQPFMWIPPCRKKLEMDADYFWSGEHEQT